MQSKTRRRPPQSNDQLMAEKQTFPELRQMTDSGMVDPLRDFSEACREEFRLRNSPFDR
jgi:hypothetical protein